MNDTPSDDAWRAYWNGDAVSLYVCPRHLRAHYDAILGALTPHLPSDRPFTLLDFGCGDALAAPALAARGARVLLYDRSDAARRRLQARFADTPGITVLDDDAYAALPAGAVDRLLTISVIQYVSEDRLCELLAEWRRLIAPDGRLILADVLAPGNGAAADTLSLLRFAAVHGFLWPALRGLATTAATDYPKLRRRVGLCRYSESDMLTRLRDAGFTARRAERNVSPSPHRQTFIATPG